MIQSIFQSRPKSLLDSGVLSGAWHALRVRVRSEQAVAQVLGEKNLQCFAPGWEELKTYSDRILSVKKLAFPGYVFCRFAEAERIYVLNTPGVQGVLGTGRVPAPIEDEVILSLRSAFSSPQKVTPASYLVVGEPVRVVRGPIAGAEGTLIRTKSIDRLVISVHLLQRSVSVELDGDSVVPLQRHISAVPSVYGHARLHKSI